MTSLRGAYKVHLREGLSSIGNRRRSRGVERKNRRDEELQKRRILSHDNDMSPVVEKHTAELTTQTKKKGSQRPKADNVVERLQQYRLEKKRRQEQEKENAKSKPTFKVQALLRGSEAVLFRAGTSKSKVEKPKDVEKKVPPPKKQPVKPKEQAAPVTRGSNLQRAAKSSVDLTSKQSTQRTKKAPTPKKRLTKSKETIAPVREEPKLKRAATTVDLASKLTAAAAAKRATVASPKKFLRATRATTLQKKEIADTKKGTKSLKGSSKSTGNLLTKAKILDKGESTLETESRSHTSRNNLMDTSPVKQLTSLIPAEVPKILSDFNFGAMASSSNESASDSKTESGDNTDNFTFAGLKVKSKRKSTRKSTRQATQGDDIDNKNDYVESSDENLITFTPNLSKRKSVRRSMAQNSPLAAVLEAMDTDTDKIDVSVLKVSITPKSSKRKSIRKSLLLTNPLEDGEDHDGLDLSISVSPKSGRRSVTERISLAPEEIANSRKRPTPKSLKRKSMRRSTRLAAQSEQLMEDEAAQSPEVNVPICATPKSGRRKSKYGSKVLGSTASKRFDDMHISDLNESASLARSARILDQFANHSNALSTPLAASSKRKSIRKSFSLATALALVQSDENLNSGNDLSQESKMDVETAGQSESDIDTQVLVDMASTPKGMTSVSQKRRSLMTPLTVSSIEDITVEERPVASPKSQHGRRRSTRSRRSSAVLRRRSRKSVATPAGSARDGDVDLNGSNVSTPNSVRNIENIPRRRSTVISVSDEGTAVGRELEPVLAYKVENVRRSARASRILNELVIEKVDGEKSFFEVSIDGSVKGSRNNSINVSLSESKCNTSLGINLVPQFNNTSPFTPRKSNEVTASSNSATSTPLTTPQSALRTRHSVAPSSGFKEPGLPLSALRPAGSQRRKTTYTPKSKTPEHMIGILQKSPMVEMNRRKSRHMSSPAPKGQFFRDLITNETERLTHLSNRWNHIAETEMGLKEEDLGQIRSTVGKALLLMDQRFKQFSGLIDNYVYDLGEKKTTPTDLQGFWDMIFFQVEDVNNLFKDLEELRQSGWQVKEKTPKEDALSLKKKVSKNKPKTKGVKSNFAAFRAELQKKKAVQASSLATDQMFVV